MGAKSSKNKYRRIFMTGLEGAGKTSILNQLKGKETITRIPSPGFNHETLQINNIFFNSLDINPSSNIKTLWKHIYSDTDFVIYVIDASNKEKIDEAVEEFQKLLKEEELKECPVLIYANKQDIKEALTPNEITQKIQADFSVLRNRIWLVQGSIATECKGINEGMDWIKTVLSKKK